MAKFIYKMQNILDIKLRLEEQAKTEYGEARAKLNKEESILLDLENKKLYYEDLTRALIVEKQFDEGELIEDTNRLNSYRQGNLYSSKLNLLEIKTNDNAIETTKYKMKIQIVKVKQAEQRLEKVREKLNAAIMERKIYEKLKENAFEEFKKEIDASERLEVDELVSFKFNKTTSSEEDK